MKIHKGLLSVAVLGLTGLSVACGNSADLAGPSSEQAAVASSGSSQAELRLRCEVRTRGRSKISVDGKNLAAGSYQASVMSGGNNAISGLQAAIGDEVEFDFDSDPDNIAAGATPIPATFISSGAPSVTADILDANGQTVVTGSASCRVRR